MPAEHRLRCGRAPAPARLSVSRCLRAANPCPERITDRRAPLAENAHVDRYPDATLIAASPSTRNKARQRDPEMTSSKKGNQRYFGMKAHIGVDAESGLVHTAGVTTGKVHDAKADRASGLALASCLPWAARFRRALRT